MIDIGKYSHLVLLKDHQLPMSVRLDLSAKKAPSQAHGCDVTQTDRRLVVLSGVPYHLETKLLRFRIRSSFSGNHEPTN